MTQAAKRRLHVIVFGVASQFTEHILTLSTL
jgi:hypothetical protein